MTRGAVVHLWGGPLDGADLYLTPGELPELLGVHKTQRGELLGLRLPTSTPELNELPTYRLSGRPPGQVYVYESRPPSPAVDGPGDQPG